jgi:sugar phosphate isomerase/epimerase
MSYRLGINLGFAINRYIEPEVWTRIVWEELDLKYVQFVADLLNPFWPDTYIDSQIGRIQDSTARHGISVESIFTSAYTRVNHLMNPDAEARAFWYRWFCKLLDIGSRLGAKNAGSHFGIMTFDTYDDPDKRERMIEASVKAWQDLSFYAKNLGYDSLIFEPMSVPREMAATVRETRELMDRVNANSGVPLRVCLDIGHAPHPSERDPYAWIEALAGVSPVIHLQQTVANKSNHSPFTEEFNRDGLITREKVMAAVAKAGCRDALFAFEISHREHWDTDFRILADLRAGVDYFRPVIPDLGEEAERK